MNLEHAQPGAAASSQMADQADTPLWGRWLVLARVGRIALTLLVLTLTAYEYKNPLVPGNKLKICM